jgi:pimeloyl-ACP methyl ester carboxylesterase
MRRQGLAALHDPCSFDAFPATPRWVVYGLRDHFHDTVRAPAVARERLGVEPIFLDTGHSPFLSRPAALARLLDQLGR